MKKALTLIIFLITITTYSQESKIEGKDYDGWTYIGNQDDGDELYYKNFKENFTWFKTLYAKPKKHKEFLGDEHTTIGFMVLYKFDCDAKEMGVKTQGYLTKEGIVDSDQTKDLLIDMEVPFPDTIAEFYLNYFCNNIK